MERIGRREFFQRLATVGVVSSPLALSLIGCATGLVSYAVKATDGRIVLSIPDYAELAEVGNGIQLEVPPLSDRIVILRTNTHSFIALSPVCTHLGCTVRKEPSFFRCPCHGSTYTLDGRVVRGPAERSLERYEIQVAGQQLIIKI
jgi:cytochrome b6-f complex iron-sulfur subunit